MYEGVRVMYDAFVVYLKSLGTNIPSSVYEGILSITCIGFTLFVILKPNRIGWKWFSRLLLAEYFFLLYGSTVIFRDYNPEQNHSFIPFWSYVKIYNDDYTVQFPEKVMNLVVFLPVGMILGTAFQRIKWWQVFAVGFLVSFSIELLQFTFKRGFAEFDDVFHNSLGCLIGYMLYKSIRGL